MNTQPLLTILGGGHEIGANCYLLEWGADSYLLDAGRHPGIRGDEEHPWREFFSLPDLDRLTRAPRAILISHAHQDHIGSLPVVSRLFPETPIYTTTASAALIPLMLADASRIQQLYDPKARSYRPDYYWETFLDREDIEAIAANLRLHAVEPRSPVDLPGGLRAVFLPNSHVLGSAGILLEREDYRLFYTGDFSLSKQELHPATVLPPPDSVDTLLMESTYGGKSDELDRAQAHRELGDFVAARVAAGGSVVIPVFALGRAQDLLAALGRHKAEGRLPADLPVHLFGLARTVTEIYLHQQRHLAPNLAGLDLRRELAPRLNDERWPLLGPRRPRPQGKRPSAVQEDQEALRQMRSFLDERPRVVLATSGMLNPGSMAWLGARVVAEDERHGLLFVGYLPPQSLGGRLLAARPGDSVSLGRLPRAGGARLHLAVRNPHMRRVSYSAHASRTELVRTVEQISPKNVILVHGDQSAREQLEDWLEHRYPVHLPSRRGTLQLNNDGPDHVQDLGLIPALVLVHGRSLWERAAAALRVADPDEEQLRAWLERENAVQASVETALLARHPIPIGAWIHLVGGAAAPSRRIRAVLAEWLGGQRLVVHEHALPIGCTLRQAGEAVADLLALHARHSQVLACADDPGLQLKAVLTAVTLDRRLVTLNERCLPESAGHLPLGLDLSLFRSHAGTIEDLLFPAASEDPRPHLERLPAPLRDCFEYDEDMHRFAWSDYGRLLRQRWLKDLDEEILVAG
ncbi:MAG: MBL fold metallo-hydrolase [bacterium]|nr:MBL fold metallo-hydrolase [bacterium]